MMKQNVFYLCDEICAWQLEDSDLTKNLAHAAKSCTSYTEQWGFWKIWRLQLYIFWLTVQYVAV